jgi:hypothetical protein
VANTVAGGGELGCWRCVVSVWSFYYCCMVAVWRRRAWLLALCCVCLVLLLLLYGCSLCNRSLVCLSVLLGQCLATILVHSGALVFGVVVRRLPGGKNNYCLCFIGFILMKSGALGSSIRKKSGQLVDLPPNKLMWKLVKLSAKRLHLIYILLCFDHV